MASSEDEKLEGLSKYIFSAPAWPRSLMIIVFLGLILDAASLFTDKIVQFYGIFGFILPALVAFVLTKPMVEFFGKPITWNRSALLAMACTVFAIIISLSPVLIVVKGLFPLLFAVAMSFIFAIRLIVLVAIADYRISRMLLPALTQSLAGVTAGFFFFGTDFVSFALVLHLLFGGGVILFLRAVERPLKRNFHISALNFINAFIAHNTDGSKALEDYFRDIGEEVYVPEVNLFFRREGKSEAVFTVPNVHPGPMGEIGGGNFPCVLHDGLGRDTLVAHGCATHDFNLVSESETAKIVDAIRKSREGVVFGHGAGRSVRVSYGSVQVLAQRFGDSLLLVSTRSPEKTEDLDYTIGLAIMSECHSRFSHVAFVDGHNCMTSVTNPVMPASFVALEYMRASEKAADLCLESEELPVQAGFSHAAVPFSREQGFGDLGIQVMVVRAGDQDTAYVVFDGNNMEKGVREQLRERLLGIVDECEVMTTDSHSVNTVTGKNPVGYRVPLDEFYPFVEDAVRSAVEDCSPAEVGGSTAWCEGVVVFGSHRISQLASSVNAMLSFIAPLGVAILALAFILSFIAYMYLV